MLTIEQLLQVKKHPDYYKLTHLTGEANNENWYSLLNKQTQKGLQLSQIETMIFLKALIEEFPRIEHIGILTTSGGNAKGYTPVRIYVNYEIVGSETPSIEHLIKTQNKDLVFLDQVFELGNCIVPEFCEKTWKTWNNDDISTHPPWHEKEDINRAYKRIMKSSKSLISEIEKLSLQQVLPLGGKIKAKSKL